MEPLENWGKYLMDPLGFGGDKEKPRRAGRGEKRREEEGRGGKNRRINDSGRGYWRGVGGMPLLMLVGLEQQWEEEHRVKLRRGKLRREDPPPFVPQEVD